jgi:hypothetical protein
MSLSSFPTPSKTLQAKTALTLALLLWSAAAAAQTATLVVHNNTGATVTVFTQNQFDDSVQSGLVTIGPESRAELTVPMGKSLAFFEAIHMVDTPDHVRAHNFSHSGRHELEVFATDFGFSAMFDPPSADTGAATAARPTEAAAAPTPTGPEPSLEELGAIELLGVRDVVFEPERCQGGETRAPTYYLVDFVSSCPEGFITRGRVPPGGEEARWCAYCGAGYRSQLDRFSCCVPE